MFFVDPDGMQAISTSNIYDDRIQMTTAVNNEEYVGNDDWVNWKTKDGKQHITYDAEIKTKEQAEAKGYSNVEQVVSNTTATNRINGDKIELRKDGTYTVNGGNAINPAEKSYITEGGSTIGTNRSAISQIAPILSNSGDAAVAVGTVMVLSGVGAPIGAALITYGSYASTAGTVLDLANDVNNGVLTTEKVITKGAMMAIPEIGGAGFKALGAPNAGKLLNLEVMGADKVLDGLRETKTGPYKTN